ncbi:hypothetical protein [Kitasatospora sp. NPDC088783]|uniref:hypothetical protein n=1 Tax=Kitasatospora sp. NPDC088783 TaxID=3364077 RepID=UPI00382CB170
MSDIVVSVLDVARGAESYAQIAGRIAAARAASVDEPASGDLAALAAAFDLDLVPSGAFVARGGERVDVRTLAAGTVDCWAAYAVEDRVHPLVRARLHHLVRAAGRGGRTHAALAVGLYRQAAPVLAEPTAGRWLSARTHADAFRLARDVGLAQLRDELVREMLAAADVFLEAGEGAGTVLELLEPLAATPAIDRGPVADALERAAAACEADVHQQVECLSVLRALHPAGTPREAVDEQIVAAWRTAAGKVPGFTKVFYLNEAAAHARAAGLSDLYDAVRLDLQHVGELGMSTIRVDLGAQPDLERFTAARAAAVDAAADLREALWQVGALPAPLGDEDSTRNTVEQLPGPFTSHLLGLTTYGVNPNGPVLTGHRADQEETWRLRWQLVHMDIAGMAVTAQLDRIGARFVPDEYELLEVLQHPVVLPQESACVLAEAMQAYWLGMDRLAVRGALPVVEGMLRRLLRESVPVISTPQGATAGGVKQLGTLISSMTDAELPAPWQSSMRLLLADPKEGRNLRNVLLHDLQTQPTPRHHLGLVLQTALFLLRTAHEDRPDAATARTAPAPG